MRLLTVVATMCVVASLGGCAGLVDQEVERERLLQTDREWAAAAAAGDVARLTTFWSEDAVNFFPGAPPAHGKEAIRELVRRNRSRPGFSLNWKPLRAVVSGSGDLGYTWGPFQLTATSPGGETVQREGNYVAIWRMHPDGTWKCEVESTIFTQ